jgi:hypothetical protein
MKITSEQVIEELQKVIDALPEPKNNPDDIAIVIAIEGEITAIKYKDLDNYTIKNGEIKLK